MRLKWPTEWSWQAIVLAVAGSLIAAGIVFGITKLFTSGSDSSLVGGCAPFNLYAQNQFEPYGTLLWASPSPTAANSPGFSPNQIVTVNGWVRTRTPYTSNQPPWDSDAWYHLADNSGWVTYAGVRSTPTTPNPSGGSGKGTAAAPLDSTCSGTYRS